MPKVTPVYLFSGPEAGDRNDAVEKVKVSHKKQFGQIDEHLFYLMETPFSQVIGILQSGTLFSDGVLVVCKNAELLKKKEDIQQLSDWIENADSSSVLILVSDEISVDSKVEKLIPPQNRKKCWEMFDSDKLPWVINYFGKNGFKIQHSAAQLILDLIENNKEVLQNECSRFFVCFQKNHEITEDDVEAILCHDREENAFTLFNQMSQSQENPQIRLEKSLLILQKIRLSKDNSSVLIIAGLSSCFRKLVAWHKEGESAVFGKLQQKQYRNASKIWTLGQAAAVLAVLASTDMQIRSGGNQMEDLFLQKMLYEIIIKKGGVIKIA